MYDIYHIEYIKDFNDIYWVSDVIFINTFITFFIYITLILFITYNAS